MRAYILVGDINAKEDFLNKFIQGNKIRPFNVLAFTDPLKISEARSVKKSLGISSVGKRLIVIKDSILIEAQNALLKTLEELPDETDFIFFEDRDLLPTVVSRCKTVNLARQGAYAGGEYERQILEFVKDSNLDIASVILFVDDLSKNSSPEINIDDFELALRNTLIFLLNTGQVESAFFTGQILKRLLNKYPLLLQNNLNRRLALEKIILDSLEMARAQIAT
jgi:hypothetical protein